MNRLQYIKLLTHPLFVSAIISLLSIPFISDYFPQYRAEVTETGILGKPDSRMTWADFYNDGESEKLEWFTNNEGKATYKITGQNGYITDQQVLNGKSLIKRNPPWILDLDKDRFPEVYSFYHRNDSLFFASVEYAADSTKTLNEERFVAIVANPEGEKDYNIDCSQSEDLDKDSICELIFSIYAGYPVLPRNIFIFNPVSKKLIKSGFTGATTNVHYLADINNDGRKEILVSQYAPGNLQGKLIDGVSDNMVQLLVLDDKLNPVFKPVVFKGTYGGLGVMPVRHHDKYFLAAMYFNASQAENDATLMIFTSDGQLLGRKKISNSITKPSMQFLNQEFSSGLIEILDNEGQLTVYDLSLKVVMKKKHEWLKGFAYFSLHDINQDGKNETIYYLSDQTLGISSSGLQDGIKVIIPGEALPISTICLKKNIGKPNEISIQTGNKFSLILYSATPWYPFRYLVLVLVFGIMSGFIFFIQFLQRLALRDKYRAERRISELQLLLMRNQISPHFLFSAINSISYRLMKKDPEEANNSVVKLSRLIRSNLIATDRLSRSLKEEMEAATAYLAIVCSQCDEPFSYVVDISPETDTDIQVPVLVVQNYLENAVKHGIRSLGANGSIRIIISQDSGFLHIEISDNGIGRQKASCIEDKSDSTGKGMGLMQKFFDEVNKYNPNKISIKILDIYTSEGTPGGTRVEIDIPVNMKYRIYEK